MDIDDEDTMCEIFNGMKQSTTIERVYIVFDDEGLGVKASLSLASALSMHRPGRVYGKLNVLRPPAVAFDLLARSGRLEPHPG